MANNNIGKTIAGFFGKLLVFVIVLVFIYAACLFFIFKKLPSAMSEVSGIYGSVIAARMSNNPQVFNPEHPAAQSKKWQTINSRTSDEKLKVLSTNTGEIKKLEVYGKVLDSNSMKVINALLSMINGKKDSTVLTAEEEAQMKQQIEAILNAYKSREDMKELEKEMGKLE